LTFSLLLSVFLLFVLFFFLKNFLLSSNQLIILHSRLPCCPPSFTFVAFKKIKTKSTAWNIASCDLVIHGNQYKSIEQKENGFFNKKKMCSGWSFIVGEFSTQGGYVVTDIT